MRGSKRWQGRRPRSSWRWWPIAVIAIAAALYTCAHSPAATLLPNGEQQFINGNGVPLANGTVFMYSPATSSCKTTWKDSAQSAPNTCPITLDSNGMAVIYGTGCYRQVVFDASSVQLYDQTTCDTSASNSVFWAGTAGGTPNAITVVDAGFNATDGSIIQFIPIFTNTGATTLTPSGTGVPVAIVKDTATGAVALQGGEIVAASPSNVVSVVYSASQANFHLLNLVNQSNPTTAQTLCGAIGLKITNSSGTPNSQAVITADQTTAINPSSQTVSRTSANYTLNITTGTATAAANGMDGEAPGTSAWIYIWIIDNGAQGASLGSLSATAPTMPSGYTYKCRLGTMAVDGSGNFYRTLQTGATTEWVNAGVTNNATMRPVFNGTVGSNCSAGAVAWAAETVQGTAPGSTVWVPPTGTDVHISAQNDYNGGASVLTMIAPNANYGNLTTTNPPPIAIGTGAAAILRDWMKLEAVTLQACTSGAAGALWITGFKDKVNAQ
jgi:hypothetical protein